MHRRLTTAGIEVALPFTTAAAVAYFLYVGAGIEDTSMPRVTVKSTAKLTLQFGRKKKGDIRTCTCTGRYITEFSCLRTFPRKWQLDVTTRAPQRAEALCWTTRTSFLSRPNVHVEGRLLAPKRRTKTAALGSGLIRDV